jgi:hypothetical protein
MDSCNDRRAYLARILQLLDTEDGPRIRARAGALIDRWEAVTGIDHRHADRWRALLTEDTAVIRAAVLGDGGAAAELRHCMPFAGVLSNRERTALRSR